MRNCCAGASTGRSATTPAPGSRPPLPEPVAGPLDGLLLDVSGWSAEELADGAVLLTEPGAYGAVGRARSCVVNAPSRARAWARTAASAAPRAASRVSGSVLRVSAARSRSAWSCSGSSR